MSQVVALLKRKLACDDNMILIAAFMVLTLPELCLFVCLPSSPTLWQVPSDLSHHPIVFWTKLAFIQCLLYLG